MQVFVFCSQSIGFFVYTNNSNQMRSEEIKNNFLGKTFFCSGEESENREDNYEGDSYTITAKFEYTMKFEADGKVDTAYVANQSVKNNDANRIKYSPENPTKELKESFDSFEITTDSDGSVNLKLKEKSKEATYKVRVNDENEPVEIYDALELGSHSYNLEVQKATNVNTITE